MLWKKADCLYHDICRIILRNILCFVVVCVFLTGCSQKKAVFIQETNTESERSQEEAAEIEIETESEPVKDSVTEADREVQTGEETQTDASTGLVNINTAGVQELITLPGIGETRAQSIISYRETNGEFGSIEDIMNVSGIKEGIFGKIRDLICVK